MNVLLMIVGIIVAAVVYMLIGWLWYSPILFGEKWQKLSNIHIDPTSPNFKKEMMRAMMWSPVSAMLMAAVMICFMYRMHIDSALSGALFGFTAWAGFAVPIELQAVLYSRKPVNLYLINVGYDFCYLVAMGAVLVYFI